MKILQFGKFYPPNVGGIENVMFDITEGLNESGIQCDVLCSNDKNIFQKDAVKNYTVYRTKSWGIFSSTSITPQMIFKLREIQDDYDIIHIHCPDPMANLALFLTRPSTKIILYWHSDIIRQKKLLLLYKPLLIWLIKRADLVIGATENHIKDSDFYPYFKDKYAIVPYILDTSRFNESAIDADLIKKLSKTYKNKKIIFSLGRLVYYKGFEFLIDSAKYLNDDYAILIGGDGPLRESFLKMISDNKLSEKVFLLGKIPDSHLPTYYHFCDIFCLPSIYRSEMFGVVQLEAMAMGKPVISSLIKKSGVNLVSVHGETGIVVEAKNSKAIAAACTNLLGDIKLYNEMCRNSIKTVKNRYSRNNIINQLVSIYKDLAAKIN
jgi:rhamnosyl/mannosyltransferase